MISVPDKGQPLDVAYIYDMAQAIIQLQKSASTSANKYVTVDTTTAGPQSRKTSEARIVWGYKEIVSSTSIIAGEEKSWTYPFGVGFAYAPIVTATPVTIKDTTAGKNVTVVIKTITTTGVEGVVKFNSAGEVSVGINIIAVGIPS